MYLYKKPVCMWPRYNVLALSKRLSSSFSVLISTDGLASLGWYRVSHTDGGDRVMTPYTYTYMDVVRSMLVRCWACRGIVYGCTCTSCTMKCTYMYTYMNIVRESVKSWLGVSGSMLGVSGHPLRVHMYILYNEMYEHVQVHGYYT